MLFLAQCLMRDGDPETEGDGKPVFITGKHQYFAFLTFSMSKLAKIWHSLFLEKEKPHVFSWP